MPDWQTIGTILVICLAASLIVREIRNMLRQGTMTGCGSCSNCPVEKPESPQVLVPLEFGTTPETRD